MSLFDGQRLTVDTFKMTDEIIDKMRKGWYSDEYFNNTIKVLTHLSNTQYRFGSETSDLEGKIDVSQIQNGDIVVEMQFFTRRKPFSIACGIDEALAILKVATGHFNDGKFINTYNELEIEAVMDGDLIDYTGDVEFVKPVLKIRGKYREFGHLETPILGVLSVPTRIATNVYSVLEAANGKPVLFFPARFDHYKMQGIDGYAYWIAVQRYNNDYKTSSKASVSTSAQGDWWGGQGGGTIAHSTIACFLGNTEEAMLQFAKIMPITTPRIALVDFHNDCIEESKRVINKLWIEYWHHLQKDDVPEAMKFKLFGVRPDTSGNMIDVCLQGIESEKKLFGVNDLLVREIRSAIDSYWVALVDLSVGTIRNTEEKAKLIKMAKQYCNEIKIIVTGGFNAQRIKQFELENVPVDIYGVGSSLLENSSAMGSNNDYTADIVRVKIESEFVELSKVGRNVCQNELLRKVDTCV